MDVYVVQLHVGEGTECCRVVGVSARLQGAEVLKADFARQRRIDPPLLTISNHDVQDDE